MVTADVIETGSMKKRKVENATPIKEDDEAVFKKGIAELPLRKMDVLFSSHLPNLTCYFYVDSEGVKGIENF